MKSTLTRTLNTLLHGTLRGLLRAWVLVVPLVLALSLIRLGQLAYFWPAGYQAAQSDVFGALVQGLRFDLKVSAVAGFLLLLGWLAEPLGYQARPWANESLGETIQRKRDQAEDLLRDRLLKDGERPAEPAPKGR